MNNPISDPQLSNDMTDTSSLLKCYVVLGIGLPLTFIQLGLISTLAFFLMLGGIIWAYRLKKRPGPLFENHGRWMTRTFWISSTYFGIAIFAFAAVFSANADQSAILPLGPALQSGTASPEQVKNMILQYQTDNRSLILWSAIGCFILPVIHCTIRFVRGYRLADAGRPVENLKTWWI